MSQRKLMGTLALSRCPDSLFRSLAVHLCAKPPLPHLNTVSIAISHTQRTLIMVKINTTKAMQTSKRIRGRTQEKRLQELNLLHVQHWVKALKAGWLLTNRTGLSGRIWGAWTWQWVNESSQDVGFQETTREQSRLKTREASFNSSNQE